LCGLALVLWQAARNEASQRAAAEAQAALAPNVEALRNSSHEIEQSSKEMARLQAKNANLQRQLLKQGKLATSLAQEGINSTTGGDSFCYISLMSNDDNTGIPIVHQMGKYPLRGVVAYILDVATWERRWQNSTRTITISPDRTLEIGNLSPNGMRVHNKPITFTTGDKQRFVFYFEAENGSWEEEVQLRRADASWKQAIRVIKMNDRGEEIVLFEKADVGYPRTSAGTIDWHG
jgi:hypothetical protein